jgi:hypothetical protein
MDALSSNDDLLIDVTVNGRHYPAVQIRYISASVRDFDVLITDSQVGTMALTEDLNLELLSDTGWRIASLVDLKKALAQHANFPRPLDVPSSSEMAELRLFASYDNARDQGIRAERMEGLLAYDRCVRRVRAVLRHASIACTPLGGVFVVPDRERARTVLLRAGFLLSATSPGALTESFSGSSIYLLERSQ